MQRILEEWKQRVASVLSTFCHIGSPVACCRVRLSRVNPRKFGIIIECVVDKRIININGKDRFQKKLDAVVVAVVRKERELKQAV
jgi:hypothetical protein